MIRNNSKELSSQTKSQPKAAKSKKSLKPISLAPLSLEQALKAAIETGKITDPDLKAHKKAK